MPALPSCLIDPIWDQFSALLPDRQQRPICSGLPQPPHTRHRVVFEKLVQVLVFGCAYERIADHGCSATTIRRRREEWITPGVMEQLQKIALASYDRMIGLDLSDIAVDCCIANKAPCGGEKAGTSPVDPGKQGRHQAFDGIVDANGIPL